MHESLFIFQTLRGEKNIRLCWPRSIFFYLLLDAFFIDKLKVISALFDVDKMRNTNK